MKIAGTWSCIRIQKERNCEIIYLVSCKLRCVTLLAVCAKVDIAEPEAISLLQMMDLDRDGAVSVDDFMVRFPSLET